MAVSLKLFDTLRTVRVPVPFVPQDAAYLAANNTLYLLSPRGDAVVALPYYSPFRQRLLTLHRPCRKLYSNYSRSPLLYGLTRDDKHIMQFDDEGCLLRTLLLPFVPDKVSVSEQHPHALLMVHLSSGRLALFNGFTGDIFWQKRFLSPLRDAVLAADGSIVHVVDAQARQIKTLDAQGDIIWQYPIAQTLQQVYPLWASDIVESGYAPGRYLLYVLDASGERLSCINPSVRSRPISLRFHAPIEALAWHERASYIYALSAHTVYVVNVLTQQVARVIPAPHHVDSLYVCADGSGLAGVSASRPEVVYWQVSNRALAFRLPSAVLGGVLLPLLCFALVWFAVRDLTTALTGSLLVACDPLLFLLSRMGQIDTYVACFTVGAYVFCHLYLCALPGKSKVWAGSLMGICLGLAVASKWNGVTACFGTLLLVLLVRWRTLSATNNMPSPVPPLPARLTSAGVHCAIFIVLPLLIYVASYAPAFAQGRSLEDIARLQATMLHFHAVLPHDHELASRWWQWLFGIKSGPLFHDDEGGSGQWIYLCGAPWLWLPGIVCVGVTAVRAWRTRELFPALIVIAFGFAWLSWMFSPRTAFLYHFSTALPFLYMTVAYVIGNVRNGTWQAPTRWREYVLLLCDGYIVLAVLTLVWLYPTLTGYPLPSHAGHHYSTWWMGWLPALISH